MEHLTASTSPIPFSGADWFDPLEDAVRLRVRGFIEALVEEEAQAALGGLERYQRNGHRQRQLVVGTFGALTVSLPRVRLLDGDGRREKEWRSQTIQAYKRLTKRGRGDHRQYLPCRHQYAPCPPGAGRPVRGQGRQGRGEPRLESVRKV